MDGRNEKNMIYNIRSEVKKYFEQNGNLNQQDILIIYHDKKRQTNDKQQHDKKCTAPPPPPQGAPVDIVPQFPWSGAQHSVRRKCSSGAVLYSTVPPRPTPLEVLYFHSLSSAVIAAAAAAAAVTVTVTVTVKMHAAAAAAAGGGGCGAGEDVGGVGNRTACLRRNVDTRLSHALFGASIRTSTTSNLVAWMIIIAIIMTNDGGKGT